MSTSETPPPSATGKQVALDRPTRASLVACRRIVRKRARNFYYGMRLTPEPRRTALYTVYAFMRACDDLIDQNPNDKQPALTPAEGGARIIAFRDQMQRVIDGGELPTEADPKRPIWPAFRHVMRTYPIDPKYLHDMLDGQRLDLTQRRYRSFEQLYDYCYKVAGVVGLVCISVWGTTGNPAARQLAEYRGIAFQLTNILRDLREDAARDRVYLPADDLQRFNVDPEVFTTGKADGNFDRMMKFQIERARSYYEMSEGLESHIDSACQSTCWAMMRIYRGLLEKIAEEPRRVLTERVRLSSFQKSRIALNARFRRPTPPRATD